MSNPASEIKLRDQLSLEQGQWLSTWHDCSLFCMPHMAQLVRNSSVAGVVKPTWNPQTQNSVAMHAVNVLAGGCKTWIMPGGADGWGGVWEPHPHIGNNRAVREWFSECTQRSIAILENGQWFNSVHQAFAGLGVMGTWGIMIETGNDTPIACHSMPPSDFVFMRGWNDELVRVIITYRKKAQELLDTFPDTCPVTVRNDVAGGKPDTMHEVIHSIYRRDGKASPRYRDDPMSMPFASCWIHVAEKAELGEGGYEEMPFIAPRWLKWSHASPYGVSPAMQALADIRGVNLFDMLTATSAELAVNPRIKVAPQHTGAIDLSPGGVTQMSGPDSVSEWATGARFDVGEAITTRKENQIMSIFHADLFRALSPIAKEREMTNYVAQALEREAAANISPAMGQMTSDLINPGMTRVFMLLYRAGIFGDAPDEAFYTNEAGARFFLLPKVAQTSRMSQALNSRRAFAFSNAMARVAPLIPIRPDILDVYDLDAINRDIDLGDGMPSSWHLDEGAVIALREGRQRQQEAAMAQQTAGQAIAKDPKGMAELAGLA